MSTKTLADLVRSAIDNPPRRDSTWELTADALGIDPFIPPPSDTLATEPLLEVCVSDNWIPAPRDMFDAWTGQRRINGEPHHGPVYHIGSSTLYTGMRLCPCTTCQGTAAPHLRYN